MVRALDGEHLVLGQEWAILQDLEKVLVSLVLCLAWEVECAGVLAWDPSWVSPIMQLTRNGAFAFAFASASASASAYEPNKRHERYMLYSVREIKGILPTTAMRYQNQSIECTLVGTGREEIVNGVANCIKCNITSRSIDSTDPDLNDTMVCRVVLWYCTVL